MTFWVDGVLPEAVVFDFDGTITDTEWPEYSMVRDAYDDHGLELSIVDWEHNVGRADQDPWVEVLAAAVGSSIDIAAVYAKALVRRDSHEVTVLPGVVELLEACERAGVSIGIASSSPVAWIDRNLGTLGLLDRFPVKTGRDHVDRAKPWPDVYLMACAELGVDPTRSLAIEDSRHGCSAAKAAGMACVVVPNRITAANQPADADLILAALTEFPLARFGML